MRYDYTNDSADLVGPGDVNDRGIVVNVDGGNIWDNAQILVARDALGTSVEEVKEFQVLTNNYNAEYGQAGSIILNVVTKSGTNDFHGDLHAYFRGRNLEASNFFYNLSDPASRAVLQTRIWIHGRSAAGKGQVVLVYEPGRHSTGFSGNFVAVRQYHHCESTTNELLWSAKVDAKLTDKHMLTVRYNVQRDASSNVLLQRPRAAPTRAAWLTPSFTTTG